MAEFLTRRALSGQREKLRNIPAVQTSSTAAVGRVASSSQANPSLQVQARNSSTLSFSTLMAVLGGFFLHSYTLFKDYMKHFGVLLTTGAVVAMACSLRGDMLLVAMVTYKSFVTTNHFPSNHQINDKDTSTNESITQGQEGTTMTTIAQHYNPVLPDYLQLPDEYNMKDLLYFIVIAISSSVVMYHVVCGFLRVYFYVLQYNEPEKWKCQPHRFLTRSNELHEVVTGTMNLVLASTVSGVVVCWIMNGNYSTVYFEPDEYGYTYLCVSVVMLFVFFEGGAYYAHALVHMPWLYKTIHKHHHRYHSPTPYAAVAMSPFEMVLYQAIFLSPLFLVPIHGLVFISVLVYIYYFSIIDHSGIRMTSVFPWQPETLFHDDHHKYFHCNFGFNSYLFDWLHGTLRRKDRLYGEDIFWGRGRKKQE